MNSRSALPSGLLVVILLTSEIFVNNAFELQQIQLSIIHLEENAGELKVKSFNNLDEAGEDFKPISNGRSNGIGIVNEEIPRNDPGESKVNPDIGFKQVAPNANPNEVPLEMEMFDAHGKPKIDDKQNTLGTDRANRKERGKDFNLVEVEKPDGMVALEAIPIPKGGKTNKFNNNLENNISEDNAPTPEDKTHEIQMNPVHNSLAGKNEGVVDNKMSNITKENILGTDRNKNSIRVIGSLPKNDAKKKDYEVSRFSEDLSAFGKGRELEDHGKQLPNSNNAFACGTKVDENALDYNAQNNQEDQDKKFNVAQSGLIQDGINSVNADKNIQLNINQEKAENPITMFRTNKNFGVQRSFENGETNINTNDFPEHKLQRREENFELNEEPCHTTTTPCPTTTTTPPSTKPPCHSTTALCHTTTPCPTTTPTTTPCPTTTPTTTPCPTTPPTTKPCPTTTTTTTPCPTTTPTTTPCPTTTTTTTPCPTTTPTTPPCPTTTTKPPTTPCHTTTTPCPTTTTKPPTTPCHTTTTPCPTTTTKPPTTPCHNTTTPCPTTTTKPPTTPCHTTTTPCPTTTTKPPTTPCHTTTTPCPTTTTEKPCHSTTTTPTTTTQKSCDSSTNSTNGGILDVFSHINVVK